jgi:hypothetical protein
MNTMRCRLTKRKVKRKSRVRKSRKVRRGGTLGQTTSPDAVYALEDPPVLYRPPGYSLRLEDGSQPRYMFYVDFGKPMDVFSKVDKPERGMPPRQWVTTGLPFFITTASSSTSIIPEFKGMCFPSWGLAPNGYIVKTSSLNTPKGYTDSWQHLFNRTENYEIIKKKNGRTKPYLDATYITTPEIEKMEEDKTPTEEINEKKRQTLLFQLAVRTSNWSLLRISAKLGGGIWNLEQDFRAFVLTHKFYSSETEMDRLDPDDPDRFFQGMKKTPLFETTQIEPNLQFTRDAEPSVVEPMLRSCRLDLNLFTFNGDTQVDYMGGEPKPEVRTPERAASEQASEPPPPPSNPASEPPPPSNPVSELPPPRRSPRIASKPP